MMGTMIQLPVFSKDFPVRSLRKYAGMLFLAIVSAMPTLRDAAAQPTAANADKEAAGAEDNSENEAAGGENQKGKLVGVLPLIRVPLPISGETDSRLKAAIEQWLSRLPESDRGPTLILEFRGTEANSGKNSEFERALSIAKFLAGERLGRIRTVAYLRGPVEGHAVLPVLACEQIVVHPDAEFGSAGINETFIDETMRTSYREIAQRRRTVPVAVALGMLDRSAAVYQVETLDGRRYVLESELPDLRKSNVVRAETRLRPEGELVRFSGNELRLDHGWASHVARDRRELASVLGFAANAIEEDSTLGTDRRPLRIDLTGPIQSETINWIERSLQEHLEQHRTNFVLLTIDSPGGSPEQSLRLATALARLDPGSVRTVALISAEARADAAIIALACDQLAMSEAAVLGGPGAGRIDERQLADLQIAIRQLSELKQRDWSWMRAMIDPNLEIRRYTRSATGELRFWCSDEFAQLAEADREQWQAGEAVAVSDGLRGEFAREIGLARLIVADEAELLRTLGVDAAMDSVRPTWAHRLVEFLAKPEVAGTLLFVAWFALMVEFMSPGLSFAGFISGLCFLLFFWSHFLHGTAGWLEVLLFAAGVTCVAMEIFVLPGIGIFGVGGGILVVLSLVLASQTFVIPRNAYELAQVPSSLLTVAAAGLGAVVALFLMRRAIHDSPVFRRLALSPAEGPQLDELNFRESLVHLDHLAGKRGVAVTPLMPAGKVRFGDQLVDVISDGDLIDRDTEVRVTAVRGSEVVVQSISEATQ